MLHKINSKYISPRKTSFVIKISYSLFLNIQENFNYPKITNIFENNFQEKNTFTKIHFVIRISYTFFSSGKLNFKKKLYKKINSKGKEKIDIKKSIRRGGVKFNI